MIKLILISSILLNLNIFAGDGSNGGGPRVIAFSIKDVSDFRIKDDSIIPLEEAINRFKEELIQTLDNQVLIKMQNNSPLIDIQLLNGEIKDLSHY